MWSHYGFLRYGMVRVKGRSLIEVLPIQLSTFIPLDSCQAQRFVHLDALNLKTSRSHSVLSDACSQMLTLTLSLTLSLSLFSRAFCSTLQRNPQRKPKVGTGRWPRPIRLAATAQDQSWMAKVSNGCCPLARAHACPTLTLQPLTTLEEVMAQMKPPFDCKI